MKNNENIGNDLERDLEEITDLDKNSESFSNAKSYGDIQDDFEEMGVLESFGVFFQKVKGILLIVILIMAIYHFVQIESVLNLQLSKGDYQLEQRFLYQKLDDLSMKVESLEKKLDLLMQKIEEQD